MPGLSKRAFTLIEVLTVVAIIGILVTITTYAYNSSLTRSRDYQRLSDLKSIQNSLEQYYQDYREYPRIGTNRGNLFIARFQLEDFNGQRNCTYNNYSEKQGRFLAPRFMTQIPEDPQHILALDAGRPCFNLTGQNGQYLYVALTDDPAKPPQSFYLMAKMERVNNMSETHPSQTDLKTWGDEVYAEMGLCDKNHLDGYCSHNYYLTHAGR